MLIRIIIIIMHDAENVYLSIGCCPLKAALTMYIIIYMYIYIIMLYNYT